MKIELRSVKFYERMSDETNCFDGDLFVDGVKCGYVHNDGRGGETFVEPRNGQNKLFNECERYCETLPDIDLGMLNGKPFTIKSNLTTVVDDLFEKWLKEKEEKKIKKMFKDKIVIGVPNSGSITYWNLKQPLNTIPRNKLQEFIDNVVRQKCVNGVVILNDNLVDLGITINV